MKNERVIVVNGMQRGGTNIVWNLLQSHPDIVSPVLETGEIIYPAWMGRGPVGRVLRHTTRRLMAAGFDPCLRYVARRLSRHKMNTLHHPDNRYRTKKEVYTPEQIRRAMLATKSVGKDIEITPALMRYFNEACTVSVIRNGFTVCEGWTRRGIPLEKAAAAYDRALNEILAQNEALDRHLLVRFEDCVSDPFGAMARLCRFVGVDPAEVPRIRVKNKKTIAADGSHKVNSGKTEGAKVWVGPEEVRRYLDPAVTDRQLERLSRPDREIVARIAGHTMARAGYTVAVP